MSLTPSTMLELGTQAPDFTLTNTVNGEELSLSDFANAKALLVVFVANHCPFAQHTMPGIIEVANEYADRGFQVIAISSNDVETHPEDGPEQMKELAKKEDYPFPYLYDETQEVALSYTAACTPDLFLFNEERELVYRGQFDDSRPGNDKELTGSDLRNALDKLLAGEEIPTDQKPSTGCNIKWKSGNEPEYAA